MLIILQNSVLLQNVRFFANSIAVVNFIEIQEVNQVDCKGRQNSKHILFLSHDQKREPKLSVELLNRQFTISFLSIRQKRKYFLNFSHLYSTVY